MQTTERRSRYNAMGRFKRRRGFTTCRRSLGQRNVSSVLVIIADVLIHEAFRMALIDNDHMVHQFAAATTDPTLRHTVLPRTSETGPLRLNTEALRRVGHLRVKSRVAIKDQIAGCRIVRERLTQLLNNPNTARVPSHIEMKNAPPVMRNHEEAVENVKSQRGHSEEIHCRNRLTMVVQKCHPSLC